MQSRLNTSFLEVTYYKYSEKSHYIGCYTPFNELVVQTSEECAIAELTRECREFATQEIVLRCLKDPNASLVRYIADRPLLYSDNEPAFFVNPDSKITPFECLDSMVIRLSLIPFGLGIEDIERNGNLSVFELSILYEKYDVVIFIIERLKDKCGNGFYFSSVNYTKNPNYVPIQLLKNNYAESPLGMRSLECLFRHGFLDLVQDWVIRMFLIMSDSRIEDTAIGSMRHMLKTAKTYARKRPIYYSISDLEIIITFLKSRVSFYYKNGHYIDEDVGPYLHGRDLDYVKVAFGMFCELEYEPEPKPVSTPPSSLTVSLQSPISISPNCALNETKRLSF